MEVLGWIVCEVSTKMRAPLSHMLSSHMDNLCFTSHPSLFHSVIVPVATTDFLLYLMITNM